MTEGSYKLVAAIGDHDMALVQQLLEQKADPNGDGASVSPLRVAIYANDFAALKLLHAAGGDLSRKVFFHNYVHWLVSYTC